MSVRRALTGALTVPLLLLSACGGGDSSVADPPVSSTTSSPTQAPHRESPQHFIRRWAEAERAMQNSGKAEEYLALSAGCEACRLLAKTVKRYYKHGGYIRWGGWTIRSIRSYSPSDRGRHSFAVHSIPPPTPYRTAADAPIKHLPGGSITYVLTIDGPSTDFHVAAKAQLAE